MTMNRICRILMMGLAVLVLTAWGTFGNIAGAAKKLVIAEGLPGIAVKGETNLPGNFFLSFVYTRNLIMLDGKGNIVWSKHEDPVKPGVMTGFWDFKKHKIKGKTYYSYHNNTGTYDNFNVAGFGPGQRVILDENFNEVKRITFEASDVVEKGHPLDGHDFLLIDLDHYIMSGYIHDKVYNIPGYPQGAQVLYSYLQEVDHGKVVWDWKSIDYPELYGYTVKDAEPTADDFANEKTKAPDYVHFNAMRLDEAGHLICSFRHISTILCLDRTKRKDQIVWKLSGRGDEFGLSEHGKTSSQHYVTVDGNYFTVFDNNNRDKQTRVTSYAINTAEKKAEVARYYSFPGKFSEACGDVQHLHGDVYVIGWGRAMNDNECMSVHDFSTGKKLMSVTLENPVNFTYRCVYYD